MVSIDEVHATLVLNSLKEVGPARFQALIKLFGSARAALHEGVFRWKEVPFFDADLLERLEHELDQAKKWAHTEWERVQKAGIRLYLWQEGPYPRLLREIFHAPPLIYAMGEDISLERPAAALVGSRRCSYYGEKMARQLSSELSQAGVTTVSGLARGIDTHVHQATIESGGKTWAVVGCGLSNVYPPENRKLAKAIANAGAVISEFPMETLPFPANFPRRNRIIAGLSLGTVVIEGGDKSGSLITARLAAEEGRDVFAVPGPVTSSLSAAPLRLLQMGAAMVQSAEDILRELGLSSDINSSEERVAAVEEAYRPILEILSEEPLPRELLAERLQKEPNQLSSLLLEMELKGLVRSVPGGAVIKT
jgi:DNA processing protein